MRHTQIFLLLNALSISFVVAGSESSIATHNQSEMPRPSKQRFSSQTQWTQSLITRYPFLPPHFSKMKGDDGLSYPAELVWCGMVGYSDHLDFSVKSIKSPKNSWWLSSTPQYIIENFNPEKQELILYDTQTDQRFLVPKAPEEKPHPSSFFEGENEEEEFMNFAQKNKHLTMLDE